MKTLKDLKVGDEVLVFAKGRVNLPDRLHVLKVGKELIHVGDKDHPIVPVRKYRVADGFSNDKLHPDRSYIMTPEMHAYSRKVAHANGRIFKFGLSLARRMTNEEVLEIDRRLQDMPGYPEEGL